MILPLVGVQRYCVWRKRRKPITVGFLSPPLNNAVCIFYLKCRVFTMENPKTKKKPTAEEGEDKAYRFALQRNAVDYYLKAWYNE